MPLLHLPALRPVLARMQVRRGLRTGLAVAVAMVTWRLLHRPMVWAALGAFYVSTVDNGGPVRSRLNTMFTVLVPGSIAPQPPRMLVSCLVKLTSPARLLLLTAALTTVAHARERVTLHNGFELECLHHETLDATHVRLYLPGENNYQDLPATEIASVETIPDPPPTPITKAAPAPELDIHTLLARAGTLHNIDRELLASIVHAESAGNTHAVSRTGARGLMQLMPGTARELGVDDPTRPDQNIAGGTTYLDSLLTRYHDNLALALAAYNAGPGAVDRYHGIPPYRETRAYVLRVMTEFQRRSAAAARATLASR